MPRRVAFGKEIIKENDIHWDSGLGGSLRHAQEVKTGFFGQLAEKGRSGEIKPVFLTNRQLSLAFQIGSDFQEALRLRGASIVISPRKGKQWRLEATTGPREISDDARRYIEIGGIVKWGDWGGKTKGQLFTDEDRANLAQQAFELWEGLDDWVRNELSDSGRGFDQLFSARER